MKTLETIMKRVSVKRICYLLVGISCVLSATFLFIQPDIHFSRKEQFYIAHGGGEIEGHQKTNSKEAILNSILHDIQYIEVDLGMTSDGFLVALHDWEDYKRITNYKEIDNKPLTRNEFVNQKIHGKFTPITIDDIKEFFS